MKDILFNLALISTLTYCKENDIDPSGSHLVKAYRVYEYTLIRTADEQRLVTVTFHKNSIPSFTRRVPK
jgi:hypothetical protein